MSFIAIPASVAWLQTADDNTVRLEHYRQCLVDHAEWLRASGVDPSTIADPASFVDDGDLQVHANVVSRWPKDAPRGYHAPSLYMILQELRFQAGAAQPSFRGVLDWYVDRISSWLLANKRDPDNPNETKAEREARLNRERVARHRIRHMDHSTDDPALSAAIEAAKRAEASAADGRKWIKGEIRQAKVDMDAAILACKAERVARVQRAEDALALAEKQARDAQELVRRLKSNS